MAQSWPAEVHPRTSSTEGADRDAIREALARYCRGVDRLDAELLRSAYHPDAVDDHGPFKGERDEFVAWVIPFLRREYVATAHHLSTQFIALSDGWADVETYAIVEQHKRVAGRSVALIVSCRYVDRFERRHGQWRIAHRVVVTDLARTETVKPWEGSSPASSLTWGSRGPTDPVYRQLSD